MRLVFLLLLLALGGWAFVASANGPPGRTITTARPEAPATERRIYRAPYVPPSNRTGSAYGPRVGGGGPRSGK